MIIRDCFKTRNIKLVASFLCIKFWSSCDVLFFSIWIDWANWSYIEDDYLGILLSGIIKFIFFFYWYWADSKYYTSWIFSHGGVGDWTKHFLSRNRILIIERKIKEKFQILANCRQKYNSYSEGFFKFLWKYLVVANVYHTFTIIL